jgi:hypothetical protein
MVCELFEFGRKSCVYVFLFSVTTSVYRKNFESPDGVKRNGMNGRIKRCTATSRAGHTKEGELLVQAAQSKTNRANKAQKTNLEVRTRDRWCT